MATIIPDEGEFEQVVRALLDLADRPKDVATSSDYERLALVVPDYLYERYQTYLGQEADEEEPAPPRRRPGRPRKVVPEPEVEVAPEPEPEPEPEQEPAP